MKTVFIGTLDRQDGYNGDRVIVHVCADRDGSHWHVTPSGAYQADRSLIDYHVRFLGGVFEPIVRHDLPLYENLNF